MFENEKLTIQHTAASLKMVSTVKNSEILTVIFGGFGILLGILFNFYIIRNGDRDPVSGTTGTGDPLFFGLFIAAIFIFSIATQAFIIILGQYVLRHPMSRHTQKFIIANLVIGSLTNIGVLVASIVALNALTAYKQSQPVDNRAAI